MVLRQRKAVTSIPLLLSCDAMKKYLDNARPVLLDIDSLASTAIAERIS